MAGLYLVVPSLLLIAVYAMVRLKAWRVVAFSAFALLTIAPAGAIVLHANRYFYTADRYAYLTMLGVSGFVGILATRSTKNMKASLAWVSPACVLLAVVCFMQVRIWRSSESMNSYALLRNPNNAIALSLLATVEFKRDNAEEGLALVAAALRADPFMANANRLRYVYSKRNKTSNQERYFYRIQLVRYGWDHVAYVRASQRDAEGKHAEAAELINYVLSHHGASCESPDVFFLHGKINARSNRFDIAIAAYRKGLELAPKRTAAWFNLGMTAMQGSRWSVAEEGFTNVLAQSPNDMEATLYLGVALMNQANYVGAIAHFNDLKSRMPKLPAVYAALIDAHRRSGDAAGAQAIAEEAKRNGVVLPVPK